MALGNACTRWVNPTMTTDRSLTNTSVPDGTAPAESFQLRGPYNLPVCLDLGGSYTHKNGRAGWHRSQLAINGGPQPASQPCVEWPAVANLTLPFVSIEFDTLECTCG